jgi:CheY-like chemotaxis protein
MGGKIWVESLSHRSGDVSTNWPPQDLQTDRKGSTFFFTISLPERAEIKLSSVKTDDQTIFDRQMAEQLPLKILLAEDNIVNQKFASFTLKKLGYQVDIVNNGLEALIAVQTQSYDLILMDIQMPEMDGLSATKQIRQNSSENSIAQPYIVAMTANALPNDQQVCLDVGMDDFISKPIDIQELIRVLAQVGSTQKSKTLSPKP